MEHDIHFIHEKVALGDICVLHVPSSSQLADISMKGLPIALFQESRSSLRVNSLHSSSDYGDALVLSSGNDSWPWRPTKYHQKITC
jgi:hypothetical protein